MVPVIDWDGVYVKAIRFQLPFMQVIVVAPFQEDDVQGSVDSQSYLLHQGVPH